MSVESVETTGFDQGLPALAERLQYEFAEPGLLAHALTHRSWCAENDGFASNERLEFLGDAVLGLVVTDHIFSTYPDLPEGALAKVRASVVSSVALAEVASELDLGPHLLLGKGELGTGGREKSSILADAMEAVIGAVYLDGGRDAATDLVMGNLLEAIQDAAQGPGGHDYKTRLQELAAREFDELPDYRLTEDGPDHAKRFYAVVVLRGDEIGRGDGGSKKQAQQAAARSAWHELATPGTDHGGRGRSVAAVAPAVAGGADHDVFKQTETEEPNG